jgi:SAM-dependent methyltransferase
MAGPFERPPERGLTPLSDSVSPDLLAPLVEAPAAPWRSPAHQAANDPRFFRDVLRAYDSWVTRAYLGVRFSIIRRILVDLLANLPETGTVLNLGSGIGLFDLYGARYRPRTRFIGIDIDRRRIDLSRVAAGRLGLDNTEFVCGDVTKALPGVSPDVVVALDVLHHVTPEARRQILAWSATQLAPGGVLFLKDISTDVRWKLTFTRVLDDLMTGREPVYYFPVAEMQQHLASLGFASSTFHLWDYIPFPHVIYVARRS